MGTVDREERAVGDPREALECLLHRPELELDPELEGGRLGEPLIGRLHGDRAEASERLDADLLTRLEIHDRMEDHPDAVPGDESLDVPTERLVRLAFDLLA